MPVTIPERPDDKPLGFLRRLGWFVALYALGVLSVGLVAYGIRLWIKT
ncbi:DUF2474 family protein [Beijerinckia sp. L45]|nr:DUF2474 family protein [Beijerinckia sp. L45]